MAKELIVTYADKQHPLAPTKLERKKLYGWIEVRATDSTGSECQLVSLEEAGTFIIPKGGIGQGNLNSSGEWVDKSRLVAVDASGAALAAVPSSFDAPIELGATVAIEDFLDHLISSVYVLGGDSCQELASAVGDSIFTFPFSYRGGFEHATGFLLANGNALYLYAGTKASFDFIGLDQTGVIDETESETDEESDDLDFSMM